MIMAESKGSSKKPKGKKIASEAKLKSLLNRCVGSIDQSLPLLSSEAKKEAQKLIQETEKVLKLKFRRATMSVIEVLETAVDITISDWCENQLILLPLSKIPEEIHPLLCKGAKFYVHINTDAENVHDLVLKDFQPLV